MKKRKSISYAKWGYIFLIPFFLVYAVFSFYPLISTFATSFMDITIDQGFISFSGAEEINNGFCGLRNYTEVFTGEIGRSFYNTAVMWLMGFVPQIIISLLLAAWFTDLRLRIKAQGFFKALIYAWGARGIVALINFLLWYGNTTILLMAAIMGVDTSLYESAQIDGANSRHMFWKITMPLIRPILLYVLITSLIGGIQMYDVPTLLANSNGYPGQSLLTLVMQIQNRKDASPGLAAAICIVIFIVTAILGGIIFLATSDRSDRRFKKKSKNAAREAV